MTSKKDSPWWQGRHPKEEEAEQRQKAQPVVPAGTAPIRRVRRIGPMKPEKETNPERIIDHLRVTHPLSSFFSCCQQSYIVAEYYKNRQKVEDRIRFLLMNGEVDYIWRSRNDDRVCHECRMNNGKIFSILAPPDCGHPGMKPGCRCEMEVVRGEVKQPPRRRSGW